MGTLWGWEGALRSFFSPQITYERLQLGSAICDGLGAHSRLCDSSLLGRGRARDVPSRWDAADGSAAGWALMVLQEGPVRKSTTKLHRALPCVSSSVHLKASGRSVPLCEMAYFLWAGEKPAREQPRERLMLLGANGGRPGCLLAIPVLLFGPPDTSPKSTETIGSW